MNHVAKDSSLQVMMALNQVKARARRARNGFYDVMFVGTATNGDMLAVSVKGDKDPGYGSTSKMI